MLYAGMCWPCGQAILTVVVLVTGTVPKPICITDFALSHLQCPSSMMDTAWWNCPGTRVAMCDDSLGILNSTIRAAYRAQTPKSAMREKGTQILGKGHALQSYRCTTQYVQLALEEGC